MNPSLSKSHDQVLTAPTDRSVKLTSSGGAPLVGVALKSAVMVRGSVTMI